MMPPRSVRNHRSRQRGGSEVANERPTGGAVFALAAGGDERNADVIAGRERRDVRTNGLDDARTLVSADKRKHRVHAEETQDLRRRRYVPDTAVLVGVAHSRECHLDLHLVSVRLVDLDDFGAPRSIELGAACGLHLHFLPHTLFGRLAPRFVLYPAHATRDGGTTSVPVPRCPRAKDRVRGCAPLTHKGPSARRVAPLRTTAPGRPRRTK